MTVTAVFAGVGSQIDLNKIKITSVHPENRYHINFISNGGVHGILSTLLAARHALRSATR
jgi:hypothetical protein